MPKKPMKVKDNGKTIPFKQKMIRIYVDKDIEFTIDI